MATVTIPNTFSTGGVIYASEMNANFTAITDQVNGNLDSNNLANSAVTENKINALAVTTAKIQNDAVTEAKIEDGAVTNAKLGTGIGAAKIADGSVSDTEFQYLNGVTSAIQTQLNAKLESVDAADIASGAVTAAKLDSEAVGADPVFGSDPVFPTTIGGSTRTAIPEGVWWISVLDSGMELSAYIGGAWKDVSLTIGDPHLVISDGTNVGINVTGVGTARYYRRQVYP